MGNAQILTSFDIKDLPIRNRLAVAPMTRVSATEAGCATPEMVRYYERFARGGFGLVITEGIYTDRQYSQGYRFQPGLTDSEQAHAWRKVTDAMHGQGAMAFAQLMHAGALSQGNRHTARSVGPSAVRPKGTQMAFYYGAGEYPLPLAMRDEEIADAIGGFVQAGRRAAAEAGFDGIEIHGANGYLLDQFLTRHTNLRDDQWGGEVRERFGLTLRVLAELKQAAGGVPVGVRISQGKVNDFAHKWPEGEAAAEVVFGSLADAGADFIHVTEYEAWAPAFAESGPSLVALARKYAPDVPLIANGGLHDMARADAVMRQGADIVALGKAALANPDFPARLATGRAFDAFDPALLGPIANLKDCELAPQ